MVNKNTTKKPQQKKTTVKKTPSKNTKSSKPAIKQSDFAIVKNNNKRQSRFVDKKQTRNLKIVIAVLLAVILVLIVLQFLPKKSENTKVSINKLPELEKPESSSETIKDKPFDAPTVVQNIFKNSQFSDENIVKLAVPIYTQVFRQSCESSALRMALKYRGIETTDLELLELMGADNKPAQQIDGSWRWGDPHKMYIGDKDGEQTDMTGYGVFAEPIAVITKKKGRDVEISNDVSAQWITRQIYAGNPVVLWGISVKMADARWVTPGGVEIIAPMQTHTRLVVGVKGDFNDPAGFYINDPGLGQVIYWTTQQLMENVNSGIGQAVAIY